tara:strand:- start:29 stop:925 length:897 start_codon:yes stop_codon:yes gene_type:complete
MNYTFEVIAPESVKSYLKQLRGLEKSIQYPLENGEGTFTIDHGKDYHPFFTQQGDKTRFVIIKANSEVIGVSVGMWKKILFFNKTYNGLYVADLKINPDYRKKEIVKKLLWHLLIRWPLTKDYKGWDFSFFCTMLKNNQGVERSFKGFNPAKLARPRVLFNIYMVKPTDLLSLDLKTVPEIDSKNHINLSPRRKELILWNDGIKNIISSNSNSVFNFGHLHPQIFYNNKISQLKSAALKIEEKKGTACFAVDFRKTNLISWLKSNGIDTKTKCKLFSFSPFAPSIKDFNNIYISTGEI